MDRATYAAASGGMLQLRRLEVESNNLANINTAGFKREILVSRQQSFEDTLASQLGAHDPFKKADQARSPGVVTQETVTDFTPGAIHETGNALDVALRNPLDFFVVNTSDGPQYTRAGSFTLSANGELVTPDGAPVVGDGGPIATDGGVVKIGSDGTVYSGNNNAGRLQVVHFEDGSGLERVGNSRFKVRAGGPAPTAVDPELATGSVEASNASTIGSMIEMMTLQRRFEMTTKSLQTIDQLNGAAIDLAKR